MHDLVGLGEALLRLRVASPARLETVRQLDVQIGGAEANVAATAARLGPGAAGIAAVPANPWGERIRREPAAHGVDCAHVRAVEEARVGLYFVEYGAAPRPIRVLYDRRDSAVGRLTPDAADREPVRGARLLHLTGITPALGPAPRALAERALGEASALSFDLNYRAARWPPEGGRLVRPCPRPPVQLVDPIGAGDAYVARSLWAALRGADLQEGAPGSRGAGPGPGGVGPPTPLAALPAPRA